MQKMYPIIIISFISMLLIILFGIFIIPVPDTKSLQMKIELLENEIAILNQNLEKYQRQNLPLQNEEELTTFLKETNPFVDTENEPLFSSPTFQSCFNTNTTFQSQQDFLHQFHQKQFHQKQSMYSLMLDEKPLQHPIDSFMIHIDDDTWIPLFTEQYREKRKQEMLKKALGD